jgi:rare lipoprotein A
VAARLASVAAGCLVLAQCSGGIGSKVDPRLGVSASPRVVGPGEPVPKGGGVYRVGKPYVVGGRLYVPKENRHYHAEGLASWYGDDFHGRLTANGEVFDMASISAAHPTLPLPSYVRITNLRNGRSIVARVNDRGPYHNNRLIDVSGRTAKLLGFYNTGITKVRVDYVGPAPLEGSDDRMLMATLREHGPAPAPSKVMVASAEPFLPRPSAPLMRSHHEHVLPQARPTRHAPEQEVAEEETRPPTRVAAREPAHSRVNAISAAERVERTFGPGPSMASIADPAAAPFAGVLGGRASSGRASGGTAPVTSYAAPGAATGSAFMSGRGLY